MPGGRVDSISNITDESSLLQWTIEDSIFTRCKKNPPGAEAAATGWSQYQIPFSHRTESNWATGQLGTCKTHAPKQYNRELASLQQKTILEYYCLLLLLLLYLRDNCLRCNSALPSLQWRRKLKPAAVVSEK